VYIIVTQFYRLQKYSYDHKLHYVKISSNQTKVNIQVTRYLRSAASKGCEIKLSRDGFQYCSFIKTKHQFPNLKT